MLVKGGGGDIAYVFPTDRNNVDPDESLEFVREAHLKRYKNMLSNNPQFTLVILNTC